MAENADFVIENGILIKYSGVGGSIRIPAGVTAIRRYALCHCDALTEVSIPKGVTDIGEGAFSGCDALAKVTLPEGVTQIGSGAFKGCKALERIVIPAGATDIGDEAFRDCASLSEITIPEGVTRIGKRAFEFCTALRYIAIPASVTSLSNEAFCGCRSLERIDVSGDNRAYKSVGNTVFSKDGQTLVACPWIEGNCIIPLGVTRIGRRAFSGCRRMTGVSIHGGMTEINDGAFMFCTAILDISIGMPEMTPWKDDYVDYIRQEYAAYEKKAWRNETLLRLLMERGMLKPGTAKTMLRKFDAEGKTDLAKALGNYLAAHAAVNGKGMGHHA